MGHLAIGTGFGGRGEGPVKGSVWDSVLPLRYPSDLQTQVLGSGCYMAQSPHEGLGWPCRRRSQQHMGCSESRDMLALQVFVPFCVIVF